MLAPGSARNAQAAEVKFIKGDEKLRSLTGALKSARYNLTLPDDTSTKVIRRGTLRCQPKTGECSFLLLRPEDVTLGH